MLLAVVVAGTAVVGAVTVPRLLATRQTSRPGARPTVAQNTASSGRPSVAPRATRPVHPARSAVSTRATSRPPAPPRQPVAPLPSGLAWRPIGRTIGGVTPMAVAEVPLFDRPSATAGLLLVDLTHAQLHLVGGTTEPASTAAVPRSGVIPGSAYPTLLAAFNGGFKSEAGYAGFVVDGVVWQPPAAGLGTLVIGTDGSVRIGVWGRDFTTLAGVRSLRQNLPLMIDHGVLNPTIDQGWRWGATLGGAAYVWRSAVGLTAAGQLVVADTVGTAGELARAMLSAGVVSAMELDINPWWAQTFIYGWSANGPVPTKLMPGMLREMNRFLHPATRDFFYLTAR